MATLQDREEYFRTAQEFTQRQPLTLRAVVGVFDEWLGAFFGAALRQELLALVRRTPSLLVSDTLPFLSPQAYTPEYDVMEWVLTALEVSLFVTSLPASLVHELALAGGPHPALVRGRRVLRTWIDKTKAIDSSKMEEHSYHILRLWKFLYASAFQLANAQGRPYQVLIACEDGSLLSYSGSHCAKECPIGVGFTAHMAIVELISPGTFGECPQTSVLRRLQTDLEVVYPVWELTANPVLSDCQFRPLGLFSSPAWRHTTLSTATVPGTEVLATSASASGSASCAVCGSTANLKKCSQCGLVYYCSKLHQRSHWKAHKADCKKAAASKR